MGERALHEVTDRGGNRFLRRAAPSKNAAPSGLKPAAHSLPAQAGTG